MSGNLWQGFFRHWCYFYVDSSNMILPLSEKFSARLPLFTNFPADTKVLKIADSLLLNNINNLAQIIMADSFLMGMIEQVDIAAGNSFEIIPKIGKQVIEFGDANNAGEKFNKLKLFIKTLCLKQAGTDIVILIYNIKTR